MKSSLGFLFLGLLSLLSTASAAPAGSSSLATAPAPSAAAPGGDGHGGGCTAAKRLAALHTVNNFFTSRTEYNRTLAAKVLSKDSKYSTAANGSPLITNSVDRETSLGIVYAHGGNQVDSGQHTVDNGVNETTTHANTFLRDINRNGTIIVSQIFNKECLIIATTQTYTFPV